MARQRRTYSFVQSMAAVNMYSTSFEHSRRCLLSQLGRQCRIWAHRTASGRSGSPVCSEPTGGAGASEIEQMTSLVSRSSAADQAYCSQCSSVLVRGAPPLDRRCTLHYACTSAPPRPKLQLPLPKLPSLTPHAIPACPACSPFPALHSPWLTPSSHLFPLTLCPANLPFADNSTSRDLIPLLLLWEASHSFELPSLCSIHSSSPTIRCLWFSLGHPFDHFSTT